MKKLRYLFVLAALLPTWAIGQVASVSNHDYASLPLGAEQWSVARACGDYAAITCLSDDSRSMFTHFVPAASSYRRGFAPPSIVVYDFRVYENWVFFCGMNADSLYGVVGYFDWTGLATGGSIDFYYHSVPECTRLKRMVVYKDAVPTLHIVAVGEDGRTPVGTTPFGKIVDYPDILMQPGAYTCRDAYKGTEGAEVLSDICFTGTYVMVLGSVRYGGKPTLTLRHCDPLTPVVGAIDTLFLYQEDFNFTGYPELRMEMTSEDVAVAYRGASPYPTRVRMFNPLTMQNTISQGWTPSDKVKLYEMAFIPADESLVLLEYAPTPDGYASPFYYLYPMMTTSYTADYVYDTTQVSSSTYGSVSRMGTNYFTASCNLGWWFRDKLAALPSTAVPACPVSSSLKVNKYGNLTTNKIIDARPRVSRSLTMTMVSMSTISLSILSPSCEEY